MPRWIQLALLTTLASSAQAQNLCELTSGARLEAQDDQGTFLGTITDPSDSDSIYNAQGSYGSADSQWSIWNRYGRFGSEFSAYSPHNPSSTMPPKLVKAGRVVGYLSVNSAISAITPALLQERCGPALSNN
jgi:hypothetical protein